MEGQGSSSKNLDKGTQKDEENKETFNQNSTKPSIQGKSIFRIFGYEFVAPKGMKNPGIILIVLLLGNILLLAGLTRLFK